MGFGHYLIAGVAIFVASQSPVFAQQVTGILGDPGATTTITGQQIPPADPVFGGVISESQAVHETGVSAAAVLEGARVAGRSRVAPTRSAISARRVRPSRTRVGCIKT